MSENDPASSGLAQQEIWRKRLAAAELAYREASLSLQKALQEQGRVPSVSATAAVTEARQRKSEARIEYLRVLHIFTDLVLRGKLPQ